MKNGTAKRINDKLAFLEDMTVDLAKAITNLSVDFNKSVTKEMKDTVEEDELVEPALPVKSARGRPRKIIQTSSTVQEFKNSVISNEGIGSKTLSTPDQIKKRVRKNSIPNEVDVQIIKIQGEI